MAFSGLETRESPGHPAGNDRGNPTLQERRVRHATIYRLRLKLAASNQLSLDYMLEIRPRGSGSMMRTEC